MKCSCGVDNLPSAKFCKGCGSKIEVPSDLAQEAQKPCPSCQASLKTDAKFCNKCGFKFGEQAKAASVETNNEQTVSATQPVITEEPSKACASCGAKVKLTAKFCGSCGKSPDAPAVTPIVEPIPAGESIEEPAATTAPAQVAQVQIPPTETPPAKKKTTEEPAAKTQLDAVKHVAPTSTGSNKKMVVIAAVTLALIAGGAAAWFLLNKPEQAAAPVANAESSTPSTEVEASTNSPTASNVNKSFASTLIGKIFKNGDPLDISSLKNPLSTQTTFYEEDRTKSFVILKDLGDYNESFVVVVTDLTGKVIDAKDLPQTQSATDEHKMFVTSAKGCMVDKKPYPNAYAISSGEKLSVPYELWKLNEDGKFVDETVPNITCAVYTECVPETDNCGFLGHNQKFKQLSAKPASTKPKTQKTKNAQQPADSATKSVPQRGEQAPAIQPKQVTEPVQPQEQETTPQEEPKKKRIKGVGGFFEKLGESVKQGATESECTSAQRAMNQCSN